jgi:preprotein translocase subunit SecE
MNEAASGVDPKRMVVIFYVAAAIVLGIFLEKLLGIAFSYARVHDAPVLGDEWTISTVVGYVVAAVAVLLAWRHPRLHRVSFEIAGELKKVTWPSMRETRAATVAVVIATAIAAVILGLFDYVWAALSARIY